MFKSWFSGNGGTQNRSPNAAAEDCCRTLDCLEVREVGEIDTIPDLALLEPLGFRPGKKVCLLCRARFGGPLVAEVDGRQTALDRSLAKKIKLRS